MLRVQPRSFLCDLSPHHQWLPSRKSLRLLVERAGFRIEVTSCHSYRTPLVGFAASLLPSLEPSRLHTLARHAPVRAFAGQMLFGVVLTALAPVTVLANSLGRGSSVNMIARRAL